ncbi:MAG: organic solvent tolerance protein OstA [Bacteroidales bacterium]|jgi:lipopolysaccharide export system protein LptA|nr:organic solvent tolerance protein OstA [Bacteroidales bacterium]
MAKIGRIYRLPCILLLWMAPLCGAAQQPTADRTKIDIEQADRFQNVKAATNVYALIGNVIFRHNNVRMFCDSAYQYADQNMVEGFGNVHVIKDDTLHLYSDFANYDGNTHWAKAKYNVKLVNKSTTLTTDSLNYDMDGGVGYYDNYGTIIDSTTTLVSKIGQYFVQEDKAYFKTEVKMDTKDYTMESDTMIYELKTGITTIIGPTNIYNGKNKLFAVDGLYNTREGKAELFKRPVVTTEDREIIANSLFYDEKTGDFLLLDRVEINDTKNKALIKGNHAIYNEQDGRSLVSDSAQFLYYAEKDTLYLHADTLRTTADTIPDQKIISAYYGVRFFRTDLQGVCDSLTYWTRDSTMLLDYKPALWSESNQMTSKSMELKTLSEESQIFKMYDDAFIIVQHDSIKFNQIKGRTTTGYIHSQNLYKIEVDGNGQSIYYVTEDDGDIIGVNEAECSHINIYLSNSKIRRITYVKTPDGKMSPPLEFDDVASRLPGFHWLQPTRPISRDDIFRKTEIPEQKAEDETGEEADEDEKE